MEKSDSAASCHRESLLERSSDSSGSIYKAEKEQAVFRKVHALTHRKEREKTLNNDLFFLPSYWQVSAGNTANDALDEQRRTTKHPVEKYRVKAKIKMFPCLNMNLMTEWKSRTRKYLARGHYVGIGRGKVRVS